MRISVSAVIQIESPAVSLLDVLLAATTGMTGPELHVDSSFDGETCLVDGDESTLTDALLGLLQHARRVSGKNERYCASVKATGETVTLTLLAESGGAQWSLQFPERHP